jgi:molybdopterin converting factor small subunit
MSTRPFDVAVRVRFFAALRERLGASSRRSVRAGTTVGGVWGAFVADDPSLGRVPVRFAVNGEYVPASRIVSDEDELAVFPPMSGG